MGEIEEIVNLAEKEITPVTTVPKEYKENRKYFWLIISILAVAFCVRLYYFNLTANQTSWWDSGEYLSVAKSYAGIMNYDLSGQRLPGFPLFLSLFFKIGLSEEWIRFLTCFIPSILMLVMMYLTISKMYEDKRIALISTAIMTFLCESLFYSNRFQTENLGLVFQLLSIFCLYVFIDYDSDCIDTTRTKAIYLVGCIISAILSVIFRPGNLLFIPALVLFPAIFFWKDHKKAVIFIIASLILVFTAMLIFIPSFTYLFQSNMNTSHIAPAWSSLFIFEGFLKPWLNIFFYIGLIVAVFTLKNRKDMEKNSDLFNLLLIGIVLFAFIFIIRAPAYEYRWYFPLAIGMLVFTSKGIIDVCDAIAFIIKGKTGKVISVMAIITILLAGLSAQLSTADNLIKVKLDSYKEVKLAALWMKDNSIKSDVIFSISKPQTAYYSERKVMSYSLLNNSAQMDDYVIENRPKYITISIFEPHPNWIAEWLDKNSALVKPVNAWFQGKQPILVVYELNLSLLPTKDSCSINEAANGACNG